METKEALENKTKFNWFYLMLAVVTIYASLSITDTSRFWKLNSYELNDMKLWLLVAGLCYLINWLYGTVYFPMKYKNILQKVYVPNHELTDLSFLRGYAAAIITIFAIFKNVAGYHIWLYVLAALWLIVHYLLASFCRTDKLFYSTSVMIDEVVLMPWLDRGDGVDHRYVDIYFILPVKEDEEAWTRRVSIAYVSNKRHWYTSQTEKQRLATLKHNEEFFNAQRLADDEATELSAKIYEEIK